MTTDKTLPVVAWFHPCSDGSYEGPLMDGQIEDVRKASGAWVPLTRLPAASARIAELEAQVQELRAAFGKHVRVRASWQEQALRAFAKAVLADWPTCMPDGFDIQDLAEKHGLLKLADPKPTAPCGEHCNCVEYFDAAEWAAGVDCYRRTPLLLGDAAIAEEKANDR